MTEESHKLLMETTAVALRLADVDMRELQLLFAELFDRAALALQKQGLEQDDAVFDRAVVCNVGTTRCEAAADWLSDRGRFIGQLLGQLPRGSDPDTVRIVELKVTVHREPFPVRVIHPQRQ